MKSNYFVACIGVVISSALLAISIEKESLGGVVLGLTLAGISLATPVNLDDSE